ncbi:MAG: T9SS type A sorting domain-containing protein [Saprospiraceae bacterium]|nr:T9SS type A sorting domain-containing protein [Saprospiraceae bacterium]MBK9632191.1 T9SS type A sorting domain-containing protein [Saprospiraceae bacterium]
MYPSNSGVYYYKLRQVDQDGSYTYSQTILIKVQAAKGFVVKIYPNTVDDLLKVDLWINEDSQLEVSVYDENGKNVLTQPFGGWRPAGKYSENLRTEILMSGQYNLQIKTSSGIVNKKFTVAR